MVLPPRVLVTAGATRTYLDDLRFLTNPATGRLGAGLAAFAAHRGAFVTFLGGAGSAQPPRHRRIRTRTAVTGREAFRMIRAELTRRRYDAVFHTMGVEDFEFAVPRRGKISSRRRRLVVTLVPTHKIIDRMRGWAPGAFLAGCKLESRRSPGALVRAARRMLKRTGADVVLANAWEDVRDGGHRGVLVFPNGRTARVAGKAGVARALWRAFRSA